MLHPLPCVLLLLAGAADDDFLRLYAETRGFQSGHPNTVRPTPEGDAVLFLRGQPKGPVQTLFVTDATTGQTRELLTPAAVLQGAEQTLSPEEKARFERQRLSARGITSFQLSEDGKRLLVGLPGRLFLVDRASAKVTPVPTGEGPLDPRLSPDGRQVSYVRDHDLFVVDLASGKERRVTRGGTEEVSHASAEFVAQEEMGRFTGYWWSPDSAWIAYQETDNRGVERRSLVDVMFPERPATSFFYPRAGQANAKVRLGITPAAGGKTTWISWDAERYPYLATVVWPKAGPLTLLVQNRRQTEQILLAVDPKTGKTRELLSEKDDAWLNLNQAFPRWLDDGSGFFWRTERNGGPEVELRTRDGALASSWVKPDVGFRELVGWEPKGRWLYFTASTDPTQAVLHRVQEGKAPERVDTGVRRPALQSGQLSRDGSLLVVRTTTLGQAPRTTLHRADGTFLSEVPSAALAPPFQPSVEIRKVGKGDGAWAAIVRPRSFQKGKKLPVIVEVYAGPTIGIVHHALPRYVRSQWLADQGFIVVKIDGRGAPGRGRAWERAPRGDFSTLVDDQAAALQALGEEVPELDLTRVGITGWSFGGYMSALAVLKRPDVFQAAVAGAPVADWTDYDTHCTERMLGLPQENPRSYERSSLLTYASQLERPLLLIHGTADDNVYFQHSLKLSDALFRAGKLHEVLPLAGQTHLVRDPLAMQRLEESTVRFFKRHLSTQEKP